VQKSDIYPGCRALTTLTFFNQSGTGGTGGVGGLGGAGGTGGQGGEGATCECTGTSGGLGGNGGVGGTGGTGGVGTNATGNVIVNVPASLLGSILGKTAAAPPGPGGAGGAQGTGGNPGGGVREARAKGHGSPGSGTTGQLGPLVARAQPAPVPACQVSSLKAHSDVYLSISVGRYASKQLNLS
jgi:hypothetical protein